eukprot:GHVS01088506.1.p1 GENE.GHVS01088506.1~~GHVS01088506.1.p1  ORF type:complete len:151 (+),score=30.40 GHVS01088506.1:80-532(+)
MFLSLSFTDNCYLNITVCLQTEVTAAAAAGLPSSNGGLLAVSKQSPLHSIMPLECNGVEREAAEREREDCLHHHQHQHRMAHQQPTSTANINSQHQIGRFQLLHFQAVCSAATSVVESQSPFEQTRRRRRRRSLCLHGQLCLHILPHLLH